MQGLDRITFDPSVMGGKACIRGMRISVALVLRLIASGLSPAEVVAEYPDLDEEDVRQALQYGAWLAGEEVHSLSP